VLKTNLNIPLICVLFLLSLNGGILAQKDSTAYKYFYNPQSLKSKEYRHTVALSTARLPEDMVEEATTLIRAPLFAYYGMYGLPNNFVLNSVINSNIITYHISLGAKWIYQWKSFSLSLGYDAAYFFGFLHKFGFDSKINGWLHYPNITVGYDFNKFALSLKTEAIFIGSMTQIQDDIEISSSKNYFDGISVGLYIEQPLWKDHILIVGLKNYYLKFYYPVWAAFPTFDRYFWIPEFYVGYIF